MHHLYSNALEFWAQLTSVRLLEMNMLWLCLLTFALMYIRRWRQPAELVTTASVQRNLPRLPALSHMPQVLFLLSLLAVNIWLAKPVIPLVNETRTLETRDIFIAIDKSGSMDTIIKDADGNTQDAEGKSYPRRIDAAARATEFFVSRRQGDRVGLAVFDDTTYLHWPMTDDLSIILKKTALIPLHTNGGTNIEGTNGPIQQVIDHWNEYGKAKTKVMILVSDGDAPMSEQRIRELTAEMSALGGKLYMLGVGEDWSDFSDPKDSRDPKDAEDQKHPKNAEQIAKLKPLMTLVEALGGRIYSVADEQQMLAAVSDIDKLEKSSVKIETNETYRDVSIYFAIASCVFFLLFILSAAFTRERV